MELSQQRALLHQMYQCHNISTCQFMARDFLDQLILNEFEAIQIKNSPSDRRKNPFGRCYLNAVNHMDNGEVYVEGYSIHIDSNNPFQHAWNVDVNGVHVDHTLSKLSGHYLFKGVAIPSDLVYQVGFRKGGVWGPVLPFLTDKELDSVREYNVYNQFSSLKF
ncbi:MAG: hypothetical protein ACPG8F_08215 [Flavobacteriaceae bacterium]|jgi:hypothetical protein